MIRTIVALLGLSVLGAIFAGIHYAEGNEELRRNATPFNLAPGEVQDDFIEPSVAGGPIQVLVTVTQGSIDIYVMDSDWEPAILDAHRNELTLDKPFNYHKQWSRLNVTDTYEFSLVGDGKLRYAIILDNSDNYYDNDTVPENGMVARVNIETRYLAEEDRSLVLGFLAATPSVVLVVYTLGRQARRWRQERRDQTEAA